MVSYDEEATYFEDGVRSAKRKLLEDKLLQVMLIVGLFMLLSFAECDPFCYYLTDIYRRYIQLVQPAYQLMLEHIRSETLENFKKALKESLDGGIGFAVAARDCTTKFTRLFDEQCQGIANKF